jgi:hypothetical protein
VLETVDESDARVSKSSSRRRQHVRVIDDVKTHVYFERWTSCQNRVPRELRIGV